MTETGSSNAGGTGRTPTPPPPPKSKGAPPAPPGAGQETPPEKELLDLVWDADFAKKAGLIVLGAFVAIAAIALIILATGLAGDLTRDDVVSITAVLLVIAGTGIAACGAWILLVELRGRSPRAAQVLATASAEGTPGDVVEPALKAIGGMRGGIALVVVGGLMAASSAWMVGATMKTDSPPTSTTVPAKAATTPVPTTVPVKVTVAPVPTKPAVVTTAPKPGG